MIQNFRDWPESPYILIGKAALLLLELGEHITTEAIRDCVQTLDDEKDAAMVRRTLDILDHRSALSS